MCRWIDEWMECLGGDVNRMVCGTGDGMDGLGLDRVELSLGLGDCVWCVLLPKPVANATISSKTTPPVSHN